MNKNIYLFILFALTLIANSIGQETLSSFDIKLKFPNQIEPLVIPDSKSNIHFFYASEDKITHLVHNTRTKGQSKKIYSRPSNIFPRLHGFSIEKDDTINLFFSNYENNGFLLMSLNEKNEKIYAKQFPLQFDKKERFLETINHEQRFHMLTYVKGTSIIKRYTFSKEGSTSTIYDLSEYIFYNSNENEVLLSNIITSNKDCSIIQENIPLSIEISSKKLKIYPYDKQLLLSFDHRLTGTKILRLSLLDNNSESIFLKTSLKKDANFIKKSNSFILNNNIYQLRVSKDTLLFEINNLLTKEQLKTFSFSKNDTIDFKNGPIYEQSDVPTFFIPKRSVSNRKVITNTNELLRKLSNSDVGIQVFNKEDILDITIGGVNVTPGKIMSIINTSSISIINSSSSFSPIQNMSHTTMPFSYSFHSYINSKSIFFKSLLQDHTLNHIPSNSSNMLNNVFDKMSMRSRYLKNSVLKNKLAIETFFKMEDFFVYGYYNKKEKTYNLVKYK
ncbi:hypothetical protein [uncultured Maribacter sp.]|uniref:hypothetical protein n=1 Tax=uncultured Maribacter sp. TaxID=431308 RepID=UPI0030DD95E8